MLARARSTPQRAQLDTAHLRHTARTRSGATNTRTPIPDDSARPRRRRIGALLLVVVAVVVLGSGAVLSYYVDALWFVFLAIKPGRFDEIIGGRILINRQWVQLPIEPILKLLALGLAIVSAVVVGASMMGSWTTLALFWHAPQDTGTLDPIFGKPLGFYLFTLPVWQLIAGWLQALTVIACLIAAVFVLATSRASGLNKHGGD